MFLNTVQTGRRKLLKLSPLAVAAASTSIGCMAFAKTPAPSLAEAVFNVRAYGAIGDGKTVDTRAINRAIEAVAAAGGGTLVFPAGTYMCFTIRLRSSVELYLSRGCVIFTADSPKPGETTGYNGQKCSPASDADRVRRFREHLVKLRDYLCPNWSGLTNYARERRRGLRISSAPAESAMSHLVNQRMGKTSANALVC